jgi:hypothetical protein
MTRLAWTQTGPCGISVVHPELLAITAGTLVVLWTALSAARFFVVVLVCWATMQLPIARSVATHGLGPWLELTTMFMSGSPRSNRSIAHSWYPFSIFFEWCVEAKNSQAQSTECRVAEGLSCVAHHNVFAVPHGCTRYTSAVCRKRQPLRCAASPGIQSRAFGQNRFRSKRQLEDSSLNHLANPKVLKERKAGFSRGWYAGDRLQAGRFN